MIALINRLVAVLIAFVFVNASVAQDSAGSNKTVAQDSAASKKTDAERDSDTIQLTKDGAYKHRPVWSPDGKSLIFARHENGGNAIFLRIAALGDASEPKRLTKRKDPEYHAVLSPDGKQLLFTQITLSGTQGNLDIAVMPRDGSAEPKTVAGDHGKLSHQDWPAWLPDNKRFVFNSTHEGNQELYLASVDGSQPLKRLTQSPGQDVHPAVSPDGRFVVFATDRWGGFELAKLDLESLDIVRLTESKRLDDYPAISPDGRRIAFVSNRDGNLNIWITDFEGHAHRLTDLETPDLFPVFTPDGQSVTFLAGRHGNTDIYQKKIPAEWLKSDGK